MDEDIYDISQPDAKNRFWWKSDGHCWYCGCEMLPFTDFSIDHVVPRARGGRDTWDNLVPCCRFCNSSKGSKTLEEFRDFHTDFRFTERQMFMFLANKIQPPEIEAHVFWFESAGKEIVHERS
jgi:hypothetical protein